MGLSVIVPAADRPPTLERCIASIRSALAPEDELLVIDRPANATATVARNTGAQRAAGDILVFVDADVEIHPDALQRIREAFADDAELVGVFGAYDDSPEGGVVGGFRNLLHHYVHKGSAGEIGTFWAGLGAIRTDAFAAAGGFVEHPVEDIELGMRLAEEGAKLVLDPEIQGKHLKDWRLWGMIRTDFAVRGVPWVGLMLRHRQVAATLNVTWKRRVSALSCVVLVTSVLVAPFAVLWLIPAGAALAALLALNADFYALLIRRRGALQACAGVLLHVIHQLVAVAALLCGLIAYARQGEDVRVPARLA